MDSASGVTRAQNKQPLMLQMRNVEKRCKTDRYTIVRGNVASFFAKIMNNFRHSAAIVGISMPCKETVEIYLSFHSSVAIIMPRLQYYWISINGQALKFDLVVAKEQRDDDQSIITKRIDVCLISNSSSIVRYILLYHSTYSRHYTFQYISR